MGGISIASLFVELGVKKENEMFKALVNVETGLGKVASGGLAAKAAVLGVMYGLERMTSSSASWGNNLARFGALTGTNGVQIQKWGYAAILAGGQMQDMNTAFMASQKNMSQMALTGQMNAPTAMMAQLMGNQGVSFDMTKAEQNPFYLMTKAMQFAKMTNNPQMAGRGNTILEGMGYSPDAITDWRSSAFNAKNIKNAPAMGVGEQNSLRNAHVAMSKLNYATKKKFADFISQNSKTIIEDLTALTNAILLLTTVAMQIVNFFSNGSGAKAAAWVGGKIGKASSYLDEGNYGKLFDMFRVSMRTPYSPQIGPGGGMIIHHHHKYDVRQNNTFSGEGASGSWKDHSWAHDKLRGGLKGAINGAVAASPAGARGLNSH